MGDPILARRLAHARYIAAGILAAEPPRAVRPKSKQRDRHRVIGQRRCACGELFDVTTKRPDKKSCGRYCSGRIAALSEGAKRGMESRRLDVWQRHVNEHMNGRKVTVGLLVDMCASAYRKGYFSGYRVGRQGYARECK